MRIVPFIVSLLLTLALVFALNWRWGPVPAVGAFLSPQQGFWQNTESRDASFGGTLRLPGLKGNAQVYFDERLVPHVFAEQDADAYYIQGYLHARFRLWQMEFQTLAAAGRVSEVLGADERFLRFDRDQRRLGMVFAAENAESAMNSDVVHKPFFDAYTAGVNAYINNLTVKDLPVEYKLLGYQPERWSNLKTALLLKMMAKDLAGFERDLEFTNMQSAFTEQEMRVLFAQVPDSLIPIIPQGTVFNAPGVVPVKPASADSLYFRWDTAGRRDTPRIPPVDEGTKPDRNNGSNNWAVSGTRTASGAPILCNDPHLRLTLPAIWYELQLTTPNMNVYGVSLPGAPSIIIGFNDSIAFGVTNAQRDVKDHYRIRFKDNTRKEYWYNGQWEPARQRMEEIRVKGGSTFYDTVSYTVFGPVQYDASFTHELSGGDAIATRWVAHDPSNEGAVFLQLNKARNYAEYLNAIKGFNSPGQNMVFASKSGDIALWQQGRFPAQWTGQGQYIMPGEDTTYAWQGFIPQEENPHVLNPAEGFIQSANQRPVDTSYPYYIPGNYITARGITAYRKLSALQGVTPDDMMQLQLDNFSSLAEDAVPLLLKNIRTEGLDQPAQRYLDQLRSWDFRVEAKSVTPTIYQAWLDSLESVIWSDELNRVEGPVARPDEQILIELLLRDSASRYIDDITTSQQETLPEQVTKAFQLAFAGLRKEETTNGLVWWKHKGFSVQHLLGSAVKPFGSPVKEVSGWGNVLNAITATNGPSWRMIVHLTPQTEAWGIYPAGQNGNPGSRFYDSFIDTWVAGKYYPLWLMKREEARDRRVKWTLNLLPA
ncbi:MAG TPA: penicillin acylase family protein [Chitinophagaceae bacterium]|jgi:penicillin amidase|nr:penicillin acylase family protein [Chitinophagaceae bacterium]